MWGVGGDFNGERERLEVFLFISIGIMLSSCTQIGCFSVSFNRKPGTNYKIKNLWPSLRMSGDPCDANAPWAGVTCNWSYGSVISLELKGNNLKGRFDQLVGYASLKNIES